MILFKNINFFNKSYNSNNFFFLQKNHESIKYEGLKTEDDGPFLKRKKPAENRSLFPNNSTVIKLPKFQESLETFSNDNDDGSQQAYKIKKKVDKFRTKEQEKNNKTRNLMTIPKPLIEINTTQRNESLSTNRSKKKSKRDRFKVQNTFIKKKPTLEPKYSYKDLGIPNPQEFNYDSYKKDWCRYCGTRFSGSFTKGPW